MATQVNTDAERVKLYRNEVRQLAEGKFELTPHAVESFRFRIAKIFPRSKAERIIREAIIRSASLETPSQILNKSFQHDGWNATIRGEHHLFEAGLKKPIPGFGGEIVVATILETWGSASRLQRFELGQRVDMQQHQQIVNEYERNMLRLEDKVWDFEHPATDPLQPLQARIKELEAQLATKDAEKQQEVAAAKAGVRQGIHDFCTAIAANLRAADDADGADLLDKIQPYVLQYPID